MTQPSCQRAALLCPHPQRQSVCRTSPSSPEDTKKYNCLESEISCLITGLKQSFHPDLPERNELAAVWHGSWQVLRWWVSVQEGVG